MSRELKFRAWIRCGEWDSDGERQAFEMIDADSLAFEECLPISQLLSDIEDERYIMQYTGLKDKNSKEIYEGDLIKDSDSNYIGQVVFDDETLCFTTKFQHNELWGFIPRHGKDNHCEIIGNVWQNPELLEGK